MNKEIKTTSGNIGLPKEIYTLKPAKNNEFNYSYEMQVFKQPENIIEEIREIIENLISKVKNFDTVGTGLKCLTKKSNNVKNVKK